MQLESLLNMNLGIIKKDGKIINHRSLLKVAFNPFLRLIGLQIVSSSDGNTIGKIILTRCPKRPLIFSFFYDTTGCVVEKKRIWI